DGSVHSDTQLGEGAVIAERTGITTINDLRNRDIAVGGQGALLAGYVDWLLLRDPVKGRAVQNLGGIGNVTFLPPLSDTTYEPIASDTGPSNALMDDVLRLATEGRQTYDVDGALGRQGKGDAEGVPTRFLRPPFTAKTP